MQDFELIVVSNRAPFPDEKDSAGGGLVVTIKDSLAKRGGIWLAARETPDASRASRMDGRTEYRGLPFMKEQDCHYKFVNNWTWAVSHGIDNADAPPITPKDMRSYKAVSMGFARETIKISEQSGQKGLTPLVWVHDYQLMSVGKELRDLGHESVIAFFLHIPVPGKADFARLSPDDRRIMKSMYADMLAYDQIGFQTVADRANFEQIAVEIGAQRTANGLHHKGRDIRLDTAPVGIDPSFYTDHDYTLPLSRSVQEVDRARLRRNLVAAIGRIDPIKMQKEVLRDYASMLEMQPFLADQVFYAMIGATSRQKVDLNANYTEATRRQYDEIRVRYEGITRQPIQLFGGIDRGEMRPLMRLLSVLHVPSRRDGFNLTAVEGVAAADPFNPAALVISKNIGAATGLSGAITYDPFEPGAMQRSLLQGILMNIPERRERWEDNMAFVRTNTAERWFDNVVGTLETISSARKRVAFDPADIGRRLDVGKPEGYKH